MGAASAALLLPQAGNAAQSSIGRDVEVQVVSVSACTAQLSIIPLKDKQLVSIPADGSLIKNFWGTPVLKVRGDAPAGSTRCGDLNIAISSNPLTFTITTVKGTPVQRIRVEDSGIVVFETGNSSLLALGEGGPQFDRRGLTRGTRAAHILLGILALVVIYSLSWWLRLDLLQFQMREIAQAQLQPGEEERLTQERHLLLNAERLYALSQDAYAALYRDETSALTTLATALEKLTQLTTLDASQQHLHADLQQSYYLIEEVARSLLAYGERMEVDPARLQVIDDRLMEIARLQRKYGPTISAILQYHEKLQREQQDWERHGERLTELTAELGRARQQGVVPNERFHYRYQAADLAWEAAALMPNNIDETARVLCVGGTWLKNIDPQRADVFYK